jgi:hypothetical protein
MSKARVNKVREFMLKTTLSLSNKLNIVVANNFNFISKLVNRCSSCCCACSQTVDALTFYRKEEERLALEELKEKKRSITLPTGVAFVTFKRLESAQKVYRDHIRYCCLYR